MAVDLDWIASRCVSALLLEVSTTPKPGLVDRLNDFRETLFEHFLLSSSALYACFRRAAEVGLRKGGRGLGRVIYDGAQRMLTAQRGGNTHLGALLLISPIASASAMSRTIPVKPDTLRSNLKKVLLRMDWRDTIYTFMAVRSVSPRGLARVPFMDVYRQETYQEIKKKRLRPSEALRPFTEIETVAHEWVRGYPKTFYGAHRLDINLRRMDVRTALAQTFLEILSRYPDTHILKRGGKPTALRVSYLASRVLDHGGVKEKAGAKMLARLDDLLRKSWKMRPGATADILASSLAVVLLSGWNP